GRLARMGRRWRVSIQSGVFGDAYYRLLCRARIVVNHISLPRGSRRIFEATNAGALLFDDIANTETAGYFRDRQECVFYDPDNLEPLLQHYLEHEEERRRLAEAAQRRARIFTFENMWGADHSDKGEIGGTISNPSVQTEDPGQQWRDRGPISNDTPQ